MKKVLVTGSAGFIAYHLIKKLKDDYEVIEIDRKTGHDILDYEALTDIFSNHKFEAVFHLAANSDISTGNPKVDFNDTFLTTLQLLDKCREHHIPRFMFFSSSAIYGESFTSFSESSGPLKPISHYGAAKLASEAFICSYAKNYGIKGFICRLPNVVGSHATHGVILDLLRKYKQDPDNLVVLGSGRQFKPYIHISELIDAVMYIWKYADAWINIYNIAPIGRTSVRTIAEMIISGQITYTGESWVGDCEMYEFDTNSLTRIGWSPKMTSDQACKLAIEEIKKEL
jgi:UDP-glucose 4-epimerase